MKDDAGHAVPSQRLSSGELVFLARDVPPLGARRYRIVSGPASIESKATARGTTLATPLVTVKVDPHSGAISSLRRRGLDAELVDGQLNGYVYLPGGNVQDARPNGPATVTVKEAGPLLASLLVESQAPGCRKLLREVRVVDGLDRVEMIDRVDKLPIRSPEGVHFAFSFNVPGAGPREQRRWPSSSRKRTRFPGPAKLVFRGTLGGRRQRALRCHVGHGRRAAGGNRRSHGPFAACPRRSACIWTRSRPRRSFTPGR